MKRERVIKKWLGHCLKSIFTVMVIYFLLPAGGRANADETCFTSDGLELSVASDGSVSGVRIGGSSLPLMTTVPSGFKFTELCPNLIANQGFDDETNGVPDHWSFVQNAGVVIYDETVGHITPGCVKISIGGATNAISGNLESELIDVEPGEVYNASAWGMTTGIGPSHNAAVRVIEIDSNNNVMVRHNLVFSKDSSGWEKQSTTFTTNAETRKLYVLANIWDSYGTFWVDDIFLSTHMNTSENYVINPEFDDETNGVPDHWSFVQNAGVVIYDETVGHITPGCVKISIGGATNAISGNLESELIDVEPGEVYNASAWGMTTGIGPSHNAAVRVIEIDSNNNVMVRHNLVFSKDSSGWEKRSTIFKTSAETSKLYVLANIWDSYGTFWVDDIKINKHTGVMVPVDGQVVKNDDNSITQSGVISNIQFTFNYIPKERYIEVHGSIHDLTGADRAVKLEYSLPINALGWQWGDYVGESRGIGSGMRYEYVHNNIGEFRKQNKYPFTCISDSNRGLSIAVPMNEPRIYRTEYNTEKGYLINYDLGLSEKTYKIGSGCADFKFIIYKLDEPEWEFRALAKKYYELYPEFFTKKNEKEGLWWFHNECDPQDIPNIEDFGFAFHCKPEFSVSERLYDHRHGLYPMQYDEPWGHWRSFGTSSIQPSDEDMITALEDDRNNVNDLWKNTVTVSVAANAVFNTAPYDENGNMYLDDPFFWSNWGTWCQNFPENPDPDLPSPNRYEISYARYELSNNSDEDYPCMGIRVDSLIADWAWGEKENYRKEHWECTDFPLVFSYQTRQPVLLGILSQYDYLSSMHGLMSSMNKRVDANIFTAAYSFYSNLIDVLGSELSYVQTDEEDALLRRTMSYHKTNRNMLQWWLEGEDTVTHAEIKTFINDQLFYGMFPSISISAPETTYGGNRYWNTPELYDRDRDLFKKYLPIIKKVSAAGWEPIPYAVCNNPNIKFERYGNAYFTIGNRSTATEYGTITVDLANLGFSSGAVTATTAVDLCSGNTVNLTISNNAVSFPVEIDSGETLVYKLGLDLAGYWNFKESGSTAYDSSDYDNDGTLVGPPSRVYNGNALDFNGVNNYVSCGNNSSLNITNAITVEAWVKNDGYGWQGIVSKWSGGKSYALSTDWGNYGKAMFFLSYDGTNYYTVEGTTCLVNTGWHHIVGTYDGNWMRLYVDGVQEGTPVNQAFNISVSTGNLIIGAWNPSSKFFNGIIDEVKVYNRALSQDEINEQYVSKQVLDFAGYWNMDEETGYTAFDSSDYGNNGTLVNMNPETCRVDGMTGNGFALDFNGVNNYVSCGNNSSLNITNAITVEAWVKNDGYGWQGIVSKWSGGKSYALSTDWGNYGKAMFFLSYDGTNYYTVEGTTCLVNTGWHHIVGTYDGNWMRLYVDGVQEGTPVNQAFNISVSTGNLIIGAWNPSSKFFNGIIDEVKVYNRALSQDEIREYYLKKVVVGSWHFNEGEDIVALDSSDNRNDGVLNGMDLQSCWIPGISGQALDFDGTDDYVNCVCGPVLNNITSAITVEAWVKNDGYGWQGIVSKWSGGKSYVLSTDWGGSGRAMFFLSYDGTNYYTVEGTTCLVNNGWHHIVGTYDGNWMRLYVDGVQEGTPVNQTFNISVSTGSLIIGSWYANDKKFNGAIDEVRIYNKALSENEINAHNLERGAF